MSDAVSGPPADDQAGDLEEAAQLVREALDHGELSSYHADGLRRVMAEYDRRGTELEQARSASVQIAEWNEEERAELEAERARVTALSSLLRGMARRAVERHRYYRMWDASERRVAAVRALADAADRLLAHCDYVDGQKLAEKRVQLWRIRKDLAGPAAAARAALGGTTDREAVLADWRETYSKMPQPDGTPTQLGPTMLGSKSSLPGSETPAETGGTPETATRREAGVHDVMRAYGIDPATYAPEIVTSSNTTPLAGSVSTTPDPDAPTRAAIDAARRMLVAWTVGGDTETAAEQLMNALADLPAALAGTATTKDNDHD